MKILFCICPQILVHTKEITFRSRKIERIGNDGLLIEQNICGSKIQHGGQIRLLK